MNKICGEWWSDITSKMVSEMSVAYSRQCSRQGGSCCQHNHYAFMSVIFIFYINIGIRMCPTLAVNIVCKLNFEVESIQPPRVACLVLTLWSRTNAHPFFCLVRNQKIIMKFICKFFLFHFIILGLFKIEKKKRFRFSLHISFLLISKCLIAATQRMKYTFQ